MKKFFIGTLFIGLASLGFSQSGNSEMKEVKLSDVTITALNDDYLDKVGESESLSPWVFTLEREASRFNVKESPNFYPGGTNKFGFIKRKGKIIATYNDDGKIVSTKEFYGDIMLPNAVREALYLAYPEWNMKKNTYLVSYDHRRGAKKVYKIQIQNDEKRTKTVKFDDEGNIM